MSNYPDDVRPTDPHFWGMPTLECPDCGEDIAYEDIEYDYDAAGCPECGIDLREYVEIRRDLEDR